MPSLTTDNDVGVWKSISDHNWTLDAMLDDEMVSLPMYCQCIKTYTLLSLVVVQQFVRSSSFIPHLLPHPISRYQHVIATIAAPCSSMARPSLCFASFRSGLDCYADRQNRRPGPSSRLADSCASFMVSGSPQRQRECDLAYCNGSLHLQHFAWRSYTNRDGLVSTPIDR
jgi:hypothetical protein